jgi:glutaminase
VQLQLICRKSTLQEPGAQLSIARRARWRAAIPVALAHIATNVPCAAWTPWWLRNQYRAAGRPRTTRTTRTAAQQHRKEAASRVLPLRETVMKRSGSVGSMISEMGDEDATDLFRSFVPAGRDLASTRVVLAALERHGLTRQDVRLADAVALLGSKDEITCAEFRKMMQDNNLIERALGSHSLAIPDFGTFCLEVEKIRRVTEANTSGKPADYIPQLARVNPDQYGVGICSVDGQRYSCGDSSTPFCVQSTTKPLAYAMALEQFGEEVVHRHVGREPSGRNFNERVLNQESRPHNPMINAGAIMTSALVRPDLCLADRWDFVMDTWTRLAGGKRPGFANSVYLSESATADRNWCLGYMMQEAKAFPENTDLKEVLEFYFMLCSIEVDAETMSTIAATLANDGVCPLTGDRVFNARTVRNTLSLMSSCGMYDYSGEFAFQMGFPCKSGVGGSLVIVVPGVTGICTWSPSLDRLGNSVRGQDFCRALVERYAVHRLDVRSSLLSLSPAESTSPPEKMDLGRNKRTEDTGGANDCVGLWYAAAEGELLRLKQLVSRGVNVDAADYDGRTALHLAAASGHTQCVKFLLAAGADVDSRDRFGAIPLHEAERERRAECIAALRNVKSRSVLPPLSTELKDPLLAGDDAVVLQNLFRHIDCSGTGRATINDLSSAFVMCGLSQNDERLMEFVDALRTGEEFDREMFVAAGLAQSSSSIALLRQALTGQLVVPDFNSLKSSIGDIYAQIGSSTCEAAVPAKTYSSWRQSITDEKAFGIGCCTVSGQRCSFGASRQTIPVAELTAALNYCLAQDLRGVSTVHAHTGHEPSGRATEDLALNDDNKPHNPLVNTGAIVSCALIDPNRPTDERFDRIQSTYREAAGGSRIGYCNQHFARERRDSDRSYCLAYMLREKGCFPTDDTTSTGLPVQETLDLFFMANSIEMDAEALSVVAATLANNGVCPITNKRVFSALAVRNCLSMMSSCGLGDFSGEFAFHVGLPGKSSRSGFTLLVVPSVLGICVWSPQLDKAGNSVRGVRFAQELVSRFNFHAFEHGTGLRDPTVHPTAEHGAAVSALLTAASTGDLTQIRRMKAEGLDLTVGDYDARTALHLAATEGQRKVVSYLLEVKAHCGIDGQLLLPKDRWGSTPLDDARRNEHEEVARLLSRAVRPQVALCDVPEDTEEHSTRSSSSRGETYDSDDSTRSSGPCNKAPSLSGQTAASVDLTVVEGRLLKFRRLRGLPAAHGKSELAADVAPMGGAVAPSA